MAKFTNDTFSGTVSVASFHPKCKGCKGCPRIVVSNTTGTQPYTFNAKSSLAELVKRCLVDIADLQKDIRKVEKEQDRTQEFYRSITALSKISKTTLLILMVIPAIQLIVCAVIVYFLGVQEELPPLLIWFLSGVSILSIAEVLITALKYFMLENKVSELEKKIEKLEDK